MGGWGLIQSDKWAELWFPFRRTSTYGLQLQLVSKSSAALPGACPYVPGTSRKVREKGKELLGCARARAHTHTHTHTHTHGNLGSG